MFSAEDIVFGTNIELGGGRFAIVTIEPDDTMNEPWREEDGHGIVSTWTRRLPYEGERILTQEGSLRLYYDYEATMLKAAREHWCCDKHSQHVSDLTSMEHAVDQDFKRLQDYCLNVWGYVGVIVSIYEGTKELEKSSVWGIESDDYDYLAYVAANELNELINKLPSNNRFDQFTPEERCELYEGLSLASSLSTEIMNSKDFATHWHNWLGDSDAP
jgi:hypothetical protein